MKLQIPNPKSQTNLKTQAPIALWDHLGILSLGFVWDL